MDIYVNREKIIRNIIKESGKIIRENDLNSETISILAEYTANIIHAISNSEYIAYDEDDRK